MRKKKAKLRRGHFVARMKTSKTQEVTRLGTEDATAVVDGYTMGVVVRALAGIYGGTKVVDSFGISVTGGINNTMSLMGINCAVENGTPVLRPNLPALRAIPIEVMSDAMARDPDYARRIRALFLTNMDAAQ